MILLTALLTITTVCSLWLVARDYGRHMAYMDTQRVIDGMAERLLYDYPDIRLLSEDGVSQYTRKQYLELCVSFGLPQGAVDRVARGVWLIVKEAQDKRPTKSVKEFSFYD